MKRPQDIPSIAAALAWLAWFASILTAMAGAADVFGRVPTPPNRIGSGRGSEDV